MDEENPNPEELTLPSESIGNIALTLHKQRSKNLEIEVSEDFEITGDVDAVLYEKIGQKLIFKSLEARNRVLAESIFHLYFKQEINAIQLFKIASFLYGKEIGHNSLASAHLLELVSRKNDIFELAVRAIPESENIFFDILHPLENAFTFITPKNVRVESIISFMDAQHKLTESDIAGSRFYLTLERWLKDNKSLAEELYEKTVGIDSDNYVMINLSAMALMALANRDLEASVRLTISNFETENIARKKSVLHCIGRLLFEYYDKLKISDQEQLKRILIDALKEESEEIQYIAIHSICRLLHLASFFDSCLYELAIQGHKSALQGIVQALSTQQEKMIEQGKFSFWLNSLFSLDYESLHSLDYTFGRIIFYSSEIQDCIIEFIEKWAEKNKELILERNENYAFDYLLNYTIKQIYDNDEFLSYLITKWLLHKDHALAHYAENILRYMFTHRSQKEVSLDLKQVNDLSDSEFFFLISRILGYVTLDPKQLLSLMLSLLNINHDLFIRNIPSITDTLINFIGRDYPSQTVQALQKFKETLNDQSDLVKYIDQLIGHIQAWIDQLDKLPRIKELSPSNSLCHKFYSAKEKQQRAQNKKADEASILSQLMSRVPVKAGKGFLLYRDGEYMESSPFHKMSFSYTLPLGCVYDEVGYHINLINFRTLEKEKV